MLRILVCALVLGGMLGGAGAAGAHSTEVAEATDAAFGALLLMPGAQPTQGRWIVPEEYAETFSSESGLIDRLRQLKGQGADFNATRHRGTLLAHAIRAGLDRVALWLLRNGANPKRVLSDRETTAYDLAREYQRSAVLEVLEKKHGFGPRKPPPARVNPVAIEPAAPASKVDEALALISRLTAASYPDEAQQQTWRRFASTLSEAEFAAVFKDGLHLGSLIRLTRSIDGSLEEALARLPLDVVRQNAQIIANQMAEMSSVSYDGNSAISYSPAALAWPVLWQRIDQPLRYDNHPDLAGRIPARFWSALFASGYAQQDAALTGCLLASVDLAAFKALWPDFQRLFSNARQEAPALVLGKYLFSFEVQACYYASSPEETIAKLAFLRQEGVTEKVSGINKILLAKAANPLLTATVGQWLPTALPPVRLVQVVPRCQLDLNDVWLSKLIKTSVIGWGIPAESVQVIEVPGEARCGLVISGSRYSEHPEVSDNFGDGPLRESWPSCPDAPDDSEIWIEHAGRIQEVEARRGPIAGQLEDVQSGRRYVLRNTVSYPRCVSDLWPLPVPYEWQAGVLHPARDALRIGRLLAAQCEKLEEYEAPKCRGFFEAAASENEPPQGEAVLAALRQGGEVDVFSLIDALGVERRRAYAAAIAARDHAAHRTLLAAGIPPHWTVAEIVALGKSGLPLEEKRRRIALLFSNGDQLASALNSARYDLTKALLAWLPRQDWPPVWRVIKRQPDIWLNTFAESSLRSDASKSGREDLLCDIDRAQGFLCGGGIELEE